MTRDIRLAIEITHYPELNRTVIELVLTGDDAATREKLADAIVTVVEDVVRRAPAE